jgi:light-regulated signal transduction histidine kinase (bacteriophytochrome)
MSALPYLDFVLDHNRKDYMEQLSNAITNVMGQYIDKEAMYAKQDASLQAEHDANLAKMTDDEIDAAGTDFAAPKYDRTDLDAVFKLMQNELFLIGKVMYHSTNSA